MTSNQIAFAGNLIEQQKADEIERHNKAVEELEEKSLANERSKIEVDKWYKEESLRLNSEALALKEQYEYEADLQLRKDIEKRQAENAAMQIGIDYEYKTKMAENARESNYIRSQELQETIRNNDRTNAIKLWSTSIDQKVADLKKYEIDTSAFFNAQRLNYDSMRLSFENTWKTNEYNTKMASIAQEQRRINLANEQFEWGKVKWEDEFRLSSSNTAEKWVNSFIPYLLPNASSVLGAAANYLK